MNDEPVIVEYTFSAPVQRVWSAITDKQQLKEWYFDIKDFKPEVGHVFEFTGGDENVQYLHVCKITELIPGKKLVHTWSYPNESANNSVVTIELFDEGNKTRIRLSHTGLSGFALLGPNFARESFLAGWTEIIGNNLKAYVEK